MLMYQWWLFSWLAVGYKLVCCRKKIDRNARKSGQKNLQSMPLQLIFSDRFQKLNMQNVKYQYNSFVYSTTY